MLSSVLSSHSYQLVLVRFVHHGIATVEEWPRYEQETNTCGDVLGENVVEEADACKKGTV